MKSLSKIMAAAAVLGILTGAWRAAADEPALVELKKYPQPAGGVEELANKVVYPPSAKEDSVSGTVYVAAEILTDGTVGQTRVDDGVRADLDSAAVNAVRGVRFTPAQQKGNPVAVWITIPIQFTLRP